MDKSSTKFQPPNAYTVLRDFCVRGGMVIIEQILIVCIAETCRSLLFGVEPQQTSERR